MSTPTPKVPDQGVPDHTAVRVALWRAEHALGDTPKVFDDTIGLALAAPEEGWRERPDIKFTQPFRASIVARARYLEDLVEAEIARGVQQYVILGAGLDTFAERRADLKDRVKVFEIDRPETQSWKKERLAALGYRDLPRFVSVDFEQGQDWVERLVEEGFDRSQPAVIASTGVIMYLSHEAIVATLEKAASLAPTSKLVVSFMLPVEMNEPSLIPAIEEAMRGAAEGGTPWRSFFRPSELLTLAMESGFSSALHVSADALAAQYFAGRKDGLRPPKNSEELVVATV